MSNSIIYHIFEYCCLSVKLAYMAQTCYTLVNTLRSTDSWNTHLSGYIIDKYNSKQQEDSWSDRESKCL